MERDGDSREARTRRGRETNVPSGNARPAVVGIGTIAFSSRRYGGSQLEDESGTEPPCRRRLNDGIVQSVSDLGSGSQTVEAHRIAQVHEVVRLYRVD